MKLRKLYVRVGATLGLSVAGLLTVGTGAALAQAPTVPDMSAPINAYGSTLVDAIVDVATTVMPYAAVFTAIGIAFAFVKGWFGRRKATAAGK